MTGWLSTLSISNLMGGQGMELWRENLLGVIGGICSAIIIAWLRWRWEHRDRRDGRQRDIAELFPSPRPVDRRRLAGECINDSENSGKKDV